MENNKGQFNYYVFGKAPRSLGSDISNLLLIFVVVVFMVFMHFSQVYTGISIKGPSMMPTFNPNYWENSKSEDIAYYTAVTEYNRGDIIIVNTGEKDIIKRVIGLPNEKISIHKDETDAYYVYINDVKLEEDYIYSRDEMEIEYENFVKLFGEEVVVPENSVFILGDNRGHSLDSTYYGCFDYDKILGKVDYIVRANETPVWSLFIQLFLPILYEN
jgi:signal peptidase I